MGFPLIGGWTFLLGEGGCAAVERQDGVEEVVGDGGELREKRVGTFHKDGSVLGAGG